MGQRKYKNIIKLKRTPDPIEGRENLVKEVLKDSTPLPNTLVYKDIDIAFKEWVEKDLAITFEDKDIPTVALFSAQRFSEYMETWENNDDQKNMLMNFKVLTRENNPQQGTLHDKNMNIPGNRTYLMKRALMQDKNGRPYFLDYRMRQPYCVDLIYTVSLVTNKYELLNDFNLLVNDKFKAIQCYIRPNGHFIPMKLENISDESEYSMDDRQYFSQSYEIRVMAYIINEEDMITEEVPVLKMRFGGPENIKNSAYVEIEEIDPCGTQETPYYFQPLKLNMYFKPCENEVTFTMNTHFKVEDVVLDNITDFKIRINGAMAEFIPGMEFKEGDSLRFYGLSKTKKDSEGSIIIRGYNPDVVFDQREDDVESELDRKQLCKDINVETKDDETIVEEKDVKCELL